MASEVDISNMALGFLGDTATVSSINPPDGSAQAGYCSRMYPIARNSLLELHPWGFSVKRVSLALLSATPPSTWVYAYAMPSDVVNILAVLDQYAQHDYSAGLELNGTPGQVPPAAGAYTPQPFVIESVDGSDVIYTNVENAQLRYTALVTDTTKFSPLFTESLAWLLASKLAGPLIKGTTGMEMSQSCLKQFKAWYDQATESDSNQRRMNVTQRTPWMANR